MALSDYEKKWTALTKEINSEIKKNAPNLAGPAGKKVLSEAQGVAGALDKCLDFLGKVEAQIGGGLGKLVGAAITHAENTTKELAGFESAAKDADTTYPLASELDKELDQFIKDAKAFKIALAKFEKQTD